MELSTWLIFSGIALTAVLSPGPAVLLSVTTSIRHGFGRSVFSSLGNILGIFMVSGLAALGLGVVLQASVVLFFVLKTAGAIYLIYMGVKLWRNRNNPFETNGGPVAGGRRHSFFQGILVALSNPKAVVFFTALFPQFIDVARPVGQQFLILTATFMGLSFLALLLYAKGAHAFRGWLAHPTRARWFNRISGAVFIAFGLGLLRVSRRAA